MAVRVVESDIGLIKSAFKVSRGPEEALAAVSLPSPEEDTDCKLLARSTSLIILNGQKLKTIHSSVVIGFAPSALYNRIVEWLFHILHSGMTNVSTHLFLGGRVG